MNFLAEKLIYMFFVLLSFIYINYKFKYKLRWMIIILCFYEGAIEFLALYSSFFQGLTYFYKILTFFGPIILILFYKIPIYKYKKLNSIFFLLSIGFLFSFIFSYNENPILSILTHYRKCLIIFCYVYIFKYISDNNKIEIEFLYLLFTKLIQIQIFLSVIKILIFGTTRESIVGSIAWGGAGSAVIIPVLAFILFWIHKEGRINKKDYFYILSLFIIGVASSKRAIWFILPPIIFYFIFYLKRKKNIIQLFVIGVILLFTIYFGIRLNPTLNKEGIVWGSFDPIFTMSYIQMYTFGSNYEDVYGKSGMSLYSQYKNLGYG